MNPISSSVLTPATAAAQAAVDRGTDASATPSEAAILLLKKAMDSDKEMVATLLPEPGARLDIRA